MLRIGHSLKIWIQAVRAPFFTASVIPVLLAAAYACWQREAVAWPLFSLVLVSTIFLHAGTNTINDYYDFKKDVDTKTSFGSSRVLVDNLMSPRTLLIGSYVLFGLGFLSGLAVVAFRGVPLLAMGLLGLSAGYLYSAKPLGLKYIGLGDVTVFIFMGPFLVVSAFYAATGLFDPRVIFISLPIAFLVTAILHANNLRDIDCDRSAGIRTWALILGLKAAKLNYYGLLIAAYVSVVVMVFCKILPLYGLAVFLSLPLAVKNILCMAGARQENLAEIAGMDVRTAQLHLVFGGLYVLALFAAALRA